MKKGLDFSWVVVLFPFAGPSRFLRRKRENQRQKVKKGGLEQEERWNEEQLLWGTWPSKMIATHPAAFSSFSPPLSATSALAGMQKQAEEKEKDQKRRNQEDEARGHCWGSEQQHD